MALNPRELLTKNAEAFAAGKVLGMSEDEVLARLARISSENEAIKTNELTARFLDESLKGKFEGLERQPSGRELLSEAKRTLNASRRQGGKPKTRVAPTPAERSAAMAAAIENTLRSEIMLEKAKRDDPTTILQSADATMPSVTKSLEGAGLEGGQEFQGRQEDDVSEFERVRRAGGGQYDEQGLPLYDVDTNYSDAIARNTFYVDGVPYTISEDKPLPQFLRDDPSVQRKLMQETYSDNHPSMNRRVAGEFEEAAVFQSAPYNESEAFNAYLVRDQDGNVVRFSRDANNELIPDPNGTITVKRVLSDDAASSFEPTVDTRTGTITGAMLPGGEVLPRPQKRKVQDIGVGSGSRARLTPQQSAVLTEIAARAQDGTLPSNVSVSSGFQDPRYREVPLSASGKISDGRFEEDTRERSYLKKNPAGGAPIRVFPATTADGQLVGDEAIRITEGDALSIESERLFRDQVRQAGEQARAEAGPRSVLGPDRGTPIDAETQRRLASQEEIKKLSGRKEMLYANDPGSGYTPSPVIADDVVYIDEAGRYYDPVSGQTYGLETPDETALSAMGQYSDEGIARTRRSRQIGEVLRSIRLDEKGKAAPAISPAEELKIISSQLGITIPEAAERVAEFKQDLGMGQSPQAFVRNLEVPVMSSGDYPQVDVTESMKRLESAVNRILPPGQAIAPIRTTAQAFEALRIYEQESKRQGKNRPTIIGEGVRKLGGATRLPTNVSDTYTPTVEEVVTARITKRDELKRVAETITAGGFGTGTEGRASFADVENETGIPAAEIKRIAEEGKEADFALEQINAVGIENAQLSESIKREISTPIQGGYLETLGTMEEFRNPSDRTNLGYALKQMELAEQQPVNQGRKQMFVDTGRTVLDGNVGTGDLKQSEQLERDIREAREQQVLPSVITPDGQRLEPGLRKDGRPAPVAQVPVLRNEDGSVVSPAQAIEIERKKIAGWKNLSDQDRADRIARFSAKQRNAAAFVPAETATFTGENTAVDTSNAGLQDASLIDQERSARANDGSEFMAQQAAPVTGEAQTLARLRAERGNLDDGVPLEVTPTSRETDYEVPVTVNPNDSIEAQNLITTPTNDPLIRVMAGTAPADTFAPFSLTGDTSPISEETARRRKVYEDVSRKPVSELPPVSRPSGAEEPGTFVDAKTGERRTYGGTYDGRTDARPRTMLEDPWNTASPIARAQAPDVATPNFNVELPPSQFLLPPGKPAVRREEPQSRRPPAVIGGGGGRVLDTILGGYRDRGGDIYQEPVVERKERVSNGRRPTDRRTARNIGLGALGAGGVALAGVGIGNLIKDEREQREGRN